VAASGADFSYAASRVTKAQEPFGAALTFAYDADGNRALVTDSFGGVTTSTYDGAGRLTSRQQSAPTQAALCGARRGGPGFRC
jgi:YD repeat-containing protein